MSAMIYWPTPRITMDPIATPPRPYRSAAPETAVNAASINARLRIIHDLIRSGDYHVPATVIADRMIEQMMIERRQRS